MKLKSLLFIASASACFAAFATNFTWTGGGDGTSWNAPANWGQSSNYPQTTGDVAIFNGNANVSLNTGSATTIGYVKVTAGTVTIDATEEGSSLNCTKAAAGNGSGLVVAQGATLIMKAPMPLTTRFDKWAAGTLIVRDAAITRLASDSNPWYIALGTNVFDGTASVSFPNAGITCGNENTPSLYLPVFFRDSANISVKGLGTTASTSEAPSVEYIQDGADTVVTVGASGISLKALTTDIQRYTLKSGTLSATKIIALASPPSGKTYQQSPTNLWYVQEGGTSTFARVTFTSGSAALRGGVMNFTGENADFTMGSGTTFEISGGMLGWPRTFNPSGWTQFRYSGRFGVTVPSGSEFQWDWSRAHVAPGTVFVHDGAGTLKFIRAISTEGVGLEIAAGKTVTVDPNCTISAPRNSIEPWKVTLNDGSILRLNGTTARLSLPLDLTVNGSGAIQFAGALRGAVVAHKLTVDGVEQNKGMYYKGDHSFVTAGYPSFVCVPYIWTGEGDGTSWNDGRNWDTGTVPPSGNTTAVDISRATTITLNDAVTVACLAAMPNGAERKVTVTGNGSISIYSKESYYTAIVVPENCELVLNVDLLKASNNSSAVFGGGKLTLGKSCPGTDTGAGPLLLVEGTLALKGVTALNHYTGSTYDRFTFRGHGSPADILIEDGTVLSADWAVFTYASYTQVNSVRQTGGTVTFNQFNYETYSADALDYTYYLDGGELTVANAINLGKAVSGSKRYPGGSIEMSGGTLTCAGFAGNGNQNYVRLYGGDVYLKADSNVRFESATSLAVTNRNEYTYCLGGVKLHPVGNHRWFRSGNIWLTGKNGNCKFVLDGDYAMAIDQGITMSGPGGIELHGNKMSLTCKANCTFTGSVIVKNGTGSIVFDGYSTLNGPSEFIVEDASSKISVYGAVVKSPERITLAAASCLDLSSGSSILRVKHLTIAGVEQTPGSYYNGRLIVEAAPASWLDGTVGDLSYQAEGTTTMVNSATTLSSLTYYPGATDATNTLAGTGVLTFSDGANIHVAQGDTLVIENDVVLGGKVTKTGEGEVVFNGAVTCSGLPAVDNDTCWLTVQEGGATFDGAVTGVRLVTCGTGKAPIITLNEGCTVTDYAVVLTAYSYGNAEKDALGETHQNGATVDYSAGVFEALRVSTSTGGTQDVYPLANPNGGSGRYVLNSGTFKTSGAYKLSFMESPQTLGTFEFVQNGGTFQVMNPIMFGRTINDRLKLSYTINGGRAEFNGYVDGTIRTCNFINFNGGAVAFKVSGQNFAERQYFTVTVGGDVSFETETAARNVRFPNDWTGDGTITFSLGNFFFSGGLNVGGLNITNAVVTLGANTALAAAGETALSLTRTGATLNLDYDGQMPFKTLTIGGRGRGAGVYSATQGPSTVRNILAGDGELLILEGTEPGSVILFR